MQISAAILVLLSALLTASGAVGQSSTTDSGSQVCPQVISCGTKDGEPKEYPTPCDAEKDGATDIKPKTGSSCTADK